MSTSVFLTEYLGILEPEPQELPTGEPQETYELGNFKVGVFDTTAVLNCFCGRFDPVPVRTKDLSHAAPIRGLYACPHCIEESRGSAGRSRLIQSWIRRRKLAIKPEQHLYIPESLQRLVDGQEVMRPRRYVYKVFFDMDLTIYDKVMCTCGDEFCVNPYHMMLSKSPARKMTPEMQEDVERWLNANISTTAILQLLKTKYQKSFSLRTIQLLKKEYQRSGFTKS